MKKILFLIVASILFLKLDSSLAIDSITMSDGLIGTWQQRTPCSQGGTLQVWATCGGRRPVCGVRYNNLMNVCHGSFFPNPVPNGVRYDYGACVASCNDIIRAGMSTGGGRLGGWMAAIIGMINLNNCTSRCVNLPDPPNPGNLTPANGIGPMYGFHNNSFSDNGFGTDGNGQCADDTFGLVGKRVEIPADGYPTRGGYTNTQNPANPHLMSNFNGSMKCRYMDYESPLAETDPISTGRQNVNIDIKLIVYDDGGSGIGVTNTDPNRNPYEKGYVKYLWSYNGIKTECESKGTSLSAPNSRKDPVSYNLQLTQEGEHKLYICMKDNAGNFNTLERGPFKLDKTAPNTAEIIEKLNEQDGYPVNTKNILANKETDNYQILYDEGEKNLDGCDSKNTSCAPLLGIDYKYEKHYKNEEYRTGKNQTNVKSKKDGTIIGNLEKCTYAGGSEMGKLGQPCYYYGYGCYEGSEFANRDKNSNPNHLCTDSSLGQYIADWTNVGENLTVKCYTEGKYLDEAGTICGSIGFTNSENIQPNSTRKSTYANGPACDQSIYTQDYGDLAKAYTPPTSDSKLGKACYYYGFGCYTGTEFINRNRALNTDQFCVDQSVGQSIFDIVNIGSHLTVKCYTEGRFYDDAGTQCGSLGRMNDGGQFDNINVFSNDTCDASIYTKESGILTGVVNNSDGTNCNRIGLDWNVSLIDNDTDTIDGKRIYNARVVNLCDEAGNCASKDFSWNLYADKPNWTGLSYYTNQLDITGVADGQEGLFGLTVLKDKFGNKIIPVADIGRNVSFTRKYDSSHKLDQYHDSGGGGVFFAFSGQNKFSQSEVSNNIEYEQVCSMISPQNCENINQVRIPNEDNNKGKYYFRLLGFSPTYSTYAPATGNDYSIKYFKSLVKDENNSKNVDWPINPVNDEKEHITSDIIIKYKPLFYTVLTGKQGSEGVWNPYDIILNQNSNLFNSNKIDKVEMVVKNEAKDPNMLIPYVTGGTIDLTNHVGDDTGKKSCARALRDFSLENDFKNFGNDCSTDSKNINKNIEIGTNNFGIGYLLSGHGSSYDGDAGSATTHIATKYINYSLSGFSDGVIGLWNSAGVGPKFKGGGKTTSGDLVKQFETKIIGMVGSSDLEKKSAMILSGQGEVNENFGGKANEKYTLTNNVRKKVTELTRGISNYSSSSFDFTTNQKQLLTDYNGFKILYKNGGNLSINGNNNGNINDDKILIIVVGGNVYINNDIQQGNNGALGIIILNGGDSTNNGYMYVHNDVTNLESFIYADGAIIRYKGTKSSPTPITQENINAQESNQIYIKGLLRVSNTLGGSRKNPVICPYFINNCDKSTAQKYDLKYFSRFYLIKEFETDTNGVQTIIHGFIPGGYLIGKIQCTNNGGTINCNDTNTNLKNIIDPSGNNPFGGINDDTIPSQYSEYLGPTIIEYDPKVKTFNVPIFSSEL